MPIIVRSFCRRCGRPMASYQICGDGPPEERRYLICQDCRWVRVFGFPHINDLKVPKPSNVPNPNKNKED